MSEIQTREKKAETIRELLSRDSVKSQIAMVAPKHLTADRIVRIAMTSIQRTPKLLECTWQSLLGSVLTCTQLGLEPDSVSGRAYLIPYGKVCTLIVGYRGLMELARRSGEIQTLDARVVYKNDHFDFAFGAQPKLQHKPTFLTQDRGDVVAAYAVAIMRNGAAQFEVMSKAEIDAIRKRSRAASDGPWVTDWNEMARKTVMRRLCKYLPSSPELSQAVTLDEQAERGIPQDLTIIDIDAEPSVPAAGQPPKTLDDVARQGQPPQPANETIGHTMRAMAGMPSATSQAVPTASEAKPPAAAESPAQPAPEPPAAAEEPIGIQSGLFKRIRDAYDALNTQQRTEIRKELGIKLVTDIGKWTDMDANDALIAIQAKASETQTAT